MEQTCYKTPQKGIMTPCRRDSSLSSSLSTTKRKMKRVSFAGDEELCKVNEYEKDTVTSSGTKLGRNSHRTDRRESLIYQKTELHQLSTIQENDDLRSSEGDDEVRIEGCRDKQRAREVVQQLKRRSFGVNNVWDEEIADVENMSMGATPDSEFMKNRFSMDNRFSIVPQFNMGVRQSFPPKDAQQSFPPKDSSAATTYNDNQITKSSTGYTEEAIEKAIQLHNTTGVIPGGAKIPRTPEDDSNSQPLKEIQSQRNETDGKSDTQPQKDDQNSKNDVQPKYQFQSLQKQSPVVLTEHVEQSKLGQSKVKIQNNDSNVTTLIDQRVVPQSQQYDDINVLMDFDEAPIRQSEKRVKLQDVKLQKENQQLQHAQQHYIDQNKNSGIIDFRQYQIQNMQLNCSQTTINNQQYFQADQQANDGQQKDVQQQQSNHNQNQYYFQANQQVNGGQLQSSQQQQQQQLINYNQNSNMNQQYQQNQYQRDICDMELDVEQETNNQVNQNYSRKQEKFQFEDKQNLMEICEDNHENKNYEVVKKEDQVQDTNICNRNVKTSVQEQGKYSPISPMFVKSPFPGGLKLARSPTDNNNLQYLKPRKLSEEFQENRSEIQEEENNQQDQQLEISPQFQNQHSMFEQKGDGIGLLSQNTKLTPIQENMGVQESRREDVGLSNVIMISQSAQTPTRGNDKTEGKRQSIISTPMQHHKSSLHTGGRKDKTGASVLLHSENRGVQTSPRRPQLSPAKNISLQQFFNKLQIPYLSTFQRCGSVLRPDTVDLDKCPNSFSEHLCMTHLVSIERDVLQGCTNIIDKSITEKKLELADKERQLAVNNPTIFQQVWCCSDAQNAVMSEYLSKVLEQLKLQDQGSWTNWAADTQEHLYNRFKSSQHSLLQKQEALKRVYEELQKCQSRVQNYVQQTKSRKTEFQRRQQVKKLSEQRQQLMKKRDQIIQKIKLNKQRLQNSQVSLDDSRQQMVKLQLYREEKQKELDLKLSKQKNPEHFTPLLREANQKITVLQHLGVDVGKLSKNSYGNLLWCGVLAGSFRVNLEVQNQQSVISASFQLLERSQFDWRISDEHYKMLQRLFGRRDQFQTNVKNFEKFSQQLRIWTTQASSARELVQDLQSIRLKTSRMSRGPVLKEADQDSIDVECEFLNKNAGCLLLVTANLDKNWPFSYIHVRFRSLIDMYGKLEQISIASSKEKYTDFRCITQNINKIIDQL